MFRVVSVGLITLSPLILISPLVISHVALRWWRGTQVDTSYTVDAAAAAAFSLLGTATISSTSSRVIGFHVINGIGERQRRCAENMRVRIVAAEIYRTGALTISGETLVAGRSHVAQLRDGDLRAFL